MEKKLILVAAPPAHGKNFVSERICEAAGEIAYFDKDMLAPLLRRGFAAAGEAVDMDGGFYLENLRDAEYETLLSLALSALRFSTLVLVNAPFLREVRSTEYMQALRARAAELGAQLVLIWVQVSPATAYARMKERNADRDAGKLLDFAAYQKRTDSSAPLSLVETDAVDRLIVFDNEDGVRAEVCLRETMSLLLEK